MYALIVEPQLRRAAAYVAAVEWEHLDPALARNEEEAKVILAERGVPEMCIVELTGAGVDGFRLLGELKATGTRVPAVVVSAFAALRDSAWKQREALGICVVLPTVLAPDALRNAVRVALGRAVPSRRGPEEELNPGTELARQARLDATGLAAAPNTSEALDALLLHLPKTFGVDAAVCSVLLSDRELIVGQAGLEGRLLMERGTEREHSIGRHVVEAVGGDALVIEDAAHHPAFANNLLVREGVLRGFVGVPLTSAAGVTLGALCLLDREPFAVSEGTVDALRNIARRISGEIELLPPKNHLLDEISDENLLIHHFGLVVQHIDQPVMIWGPSGSLRVANQALAGIFGLELEDILGAGRDRFADLAASFIDDEEVLQRLRTAPDGPTVVRAVVEVAGAPPRQFRWRSQPVVLPDGYGQIDLWSEITWEIAYQRAALTDGLTGLANRVGGERAIRREVARGARLQKPLSFLLLDIDHFKRVNDSFGHAAGDDVIKGVAQAMLKSLRASDIAARWGGEEFLAVLPDSDLSHAAMVAERIRLAVEAANFGIPARVTVSIGCAQLGPGEVWEAAIGRADAWLYEAKETGRNKVVAEPWLP